jgi:CRP-like cAMP-binding protein
MSPCQPLTKQLRLLPPFVHFSRQHVRRLGQLCATISFASGKVLAQEGEICREFVILVEGTARKISDGHEMGALEAGQHFGELAIVRGIRNPLTIVARTPVTLEVMTTREFLSAYTTMPAFRNHIDSLIDRQLASWSNLTPSPRSPDGSDLGAADADPYTLAS